MLPSAAGGIALAGNHFFPLPPAGGSPLQGVVWPGSPVPSPISAPRGAGGNIHAVVVGGACLVVRCYRASLPGVRLPRRRADTPRCPPSAGTTPQARQRRGPWQDGGCSRHWYSYKNLTKLFQRSYNFPSPALHTLPHELKPRHDCLRRMCGMDLAFLWAPLHAGLAWLRSTTPGNAMLRHAWGSSR
jgi:hypothetical protein